MGLFDYIMLALLFIVICINLFEIIFIFRNTRKIKEYENENKIKVREKNGIWIIWIILSAINFLLNFLVYCDDHKISKLILAVGWVIMMIHYTVVFLFTKDTYITSECVLCKRRRKLKISCDNYQYRIDGDTLELWYKTEISPAKYKITENKGELIKMLEDNYTPCK